MTEEEKKKAEKQLKKALAALDTAVQKWYEANAPENKVCYASCHFRNYIYDPDIGHVSVITLHPDEHSDTYIDIESSKNGR